MIQSGDIHQPHTSQTVEVISEVIFDFHSARRVS
jgi:hypothetical protein